MNKNYTIIFFGFFALILGLGSDEFIIPSEIKILTGLGLIGYGVYKLYYPKEKISLTIKGLKILPSYVYILTGVGLVKLSQSTMKSNGYGNNGYMIYAAIIIGFIIAIYGLIKLYKERKRKV